MIINMLLAVDAGNTNIVISGCIDNKVIFSERVPTDKRMTAEAFTGVLADISKKHGCAFTSSGICSVAPEITPALAAAASAVTQNKPVVVNTEIDSGLTYRLTDISDLGPDLIAGAAAAADYYSLPAVVVDTGTATTIMAIDSGRGFLGGAIVPGINTSFNALFSNASMMREFGIEAPVRAIGRNTAEAVNSGAIFGYADMIDGLCRRFEHELGCKPCYIITGGLAGRFMNFCKTPFVHDDTLVIKGICCICQRN